MIKLISLNHICMELFGLLLLIISGASPFTTHLMEQQQFAMEPQDQVAVVGARVIFPCRVLNKKGILQWTKDDFGLGTRRRLSAFERYSMVGSDEEGDYSLNIYPVTLEDDAKYQCQVGPGQNGEPGIRSNYGILSVLKSPDPPKILQGDYMVTTEDREIELECVSENAKPAAEITWIDGFGNVLTAGVEYIKEPSPDNRLSTAKSILKLKANVALHNKTIHCQAQNFAEKTYRSASIRLEVKYAPKVRIVFVDGALDTGRIPVDNAVRLRCKADAYPNELTYQWYINDSMVIDATFSDLEISTVTRKHQNFVVKCEAQNVVGLSAATETLDVIYPPSFIERPQNVETEMGENITMSCHVDSNPKADIIWVFDPIDRINFQPRVVGTSSELYVIASNETAGRYYCKAHSSGFPEISSEALIILKGPPKIISHPEQHPLDGETYEIECVAISVPKAKHVSWAFNGVLIDTDKDLGFSLRQDVLYDRIKSTLRIVENHRKYFGTYSCTVINKYGSDTLNIVFSERRKLPIIIIASGSFAISLLIIAICFSICCCIRGSRNSGKKRELPPADIIPKVNQQPKVKTDSLKKKNLSKTEIPVAVAVEPEYQESNSGSYSTTTTLSMNKTDFLGSKLLSIPPTIRYSGLQLPEGFSDSTSQSITGSYVDFSRDFYSPSIQNANNFLIQSTLQRGETPTYV
ncbi:irregular chiasm C-roughest protein-like isoform X2 [Contarinia nasturtii]|uniref:irregular chiasm C-roughest protein-like isoform X2 n=1 Tax=Contarinia nasturtii TaxID=265458 RepID=UPI0012D44BC8|nr:irregular chiasm C-roughest protein-like isoform X2 [Contarinia nasturtii]